MHISQIFDWVKKKTPWMKAADEIVKTAENDAEKIEDVRKLINSLKSVNAKLKQVQSLEARFLIMQTTANEIGVESQEHAQEVDRLFSAEFTEDQLEEHTANLKEKEKRLNEVKKTKKKLERLLIKIKLFNDSNSTIEHILEYKKKLDTVAEKLSEKIRKKVEEMEKGIQQEQANTHLLLTQLLQKAGKS
tara:strand:- start:4028 stop:4597 length:570 start_codon:yes stop_codon:yes gene_type:complete